MRRRVRRRVRWGMRWLALVGPIGVVGSVVATVLAEDRAGVGPIDGGLLSDLGASGQPAAGVYRVGLVLAALAYAGVAAGLSARLSWRDPRVLMLLGAAVSLGVQTVVRCEGACRLPGVDGRAPLSDAAHFLVAGIGFALWASVTALDVVDVDPVAPRLSPVVTAALVAHLAALGSLLVVDPYGPLTGFLQRTMVLVALAWVAYVGALVASGRLRPRPHPRWE